MLESLTGREQEILTLIALGLSNREIARKLVLSSGTVKAHSHNIYSKLGVASRTQAVLKATELGLIDPAPAEPQIEAARARPSLGPTAFVGREAELEHLERLLRDDRVRLITILGAGGMGKSRLAAEFAERHDADFEDGAFFIPLARVSAAQDIPAAVISDMHLRFQTQEQPEQRLLTFLQDKHLLLVLDNFEDLLDGVDLLTQILQTAPRVRLIVTSRERLNLSTEVVVVLGGLEHRMEAAPDDAALNDSVRLLLDRARFVNDAFRLRADDWPHLRRICQLTQGMPLALILAGGWLDMLTLEALADELASSLDILEYQLSDLPARQRSMRAVIASSWQRLNADEQAVFTRLSVFRGGFPREAAQQVAGASLYHLRTLVNRSFITTHDGRYQIHELLRQFGEGVLHQADAERTRILDRHCDYYADFLHARVKTDAAEWQRQHLLDVRGELDNIRTAWAWAVSSARLAALRRMVETLSSFWHTQSRYLEGIQLFTDAVHALDQMPPGDLRDRLIAIMSADLGWYFMRLGRLEESEACFRRSDALFEAAEKPLPLNSTTHPRIGLAILASIRGHYADATATAEEALRQFTASGDLSNQAYALYALTGIRLAQGAYDEARRYGLQALAMTEQAHDGWLRAYCLIELGSVARAQGDDGAAAQHYRDSYAVREALDDPEGMAVALYHLGQIAMRQRSPEEAERLYRQSLDIYEEIHDQGGLAAVLHGLGQVALTRGDIPACRAHLRRALQTADAIDYMPLLFSVLVTTAEMALQTGQTEEAVGLLQFVCEHPSSSREVRDRAAFLLMDRLGHAWDTPASLPDDRASVVAQVLARLEQ